jgi:hypothetical protein
VLVAAVDLILVGVMFAFVGRTLRQAVPVYGGSPEELESGTGTDANARQEGAAALLARRDPAARVLLHGHTHQASFRRLDPERVSVDSGCWIRALVPVRAVAVPRRLFLTERLLAAASCRPRTASHPG